MSIDVEESTETKIEKSESFITLRSTLYFTHVMTAQRTEFSNLLHVDAKASLLIIANMLFQPKQETAQGENLLQSICLPITNIVFSQEALKTGFFI